VHLFFSLGKRKTAEPVLGAALWPMATHNSSAKLQVNVYIMIPGNLARGPLVLCPHLDPAPEAAVIPAFDGEVRGKGRPLVRGLLTLQVMRTNTVVVEDGLRIRVSALPDGVPDSIGRGTVTF
jgi:hypothetical protein